MKIRFSEEAEVPELVEPEGEIDAAKVWARQQTTMPRFARMFNLGKVKGTVIARMVPPRKEAPHEPWALRITVWGGAKLGQITGESEIEDVLEAKWREMMHDLDSSGTEVIGWNEVAARVLSEFTSEHVRRLRHKMITK